MGGPGQMPALPSITADVLVIVEKVLDCFVTVQMAQEANCCAIAQFNGVVTGCGSQLSYLLSGMVTALAGLGTYMIAAVGVWK